MRDIRLDIRRIRMSSSSQPYVRFYKRDQLEPTYRSLATENGVWLYFVMVQSHAAVQLVMRFSIENLNTVSVKGLWHTSASLCFYSRAWEKSEVCGYGTFWSECFEKHGCILVTYVLTTASSQYYHTIYLKNSKGMSQVRREWTKIWALTWRGSLYLPLKLFKKATAAEIGACWKLQML